MGGAGGKGGGRMLGTPRGVRAALRLRACCRVLGLGVALWSGGVTGLSRCVAADVWGGSLAVTSDYFVRGISRSNDHPALQLDLHYLNAAGFAAGVFLSTTQIDPGGPRDLELSGFLGYVWSAGDDWQARALATHYSYPWSQGSQYRYDELALGATYRGWLNVTLAYSPNSPRYSQSGGVAGVRATSAELNLQHPLLGKLSGTAGIGYYELGGASGGEATGYAYGSVGAAYDLKPVTLALSYVRTTAAANTLFYNAAVGGHWTGTVVWRF